MNKRIFRDVRGATLLEYSVLIGLMLALSITLIVSIGQWNNDQWKLLRACVLPSQATPCIPPGKDR